MHKRREFTPEEMQACADAMAKAFLLMMKAAEAACRAFQETVKEAQAAEWWKRGEPEPEYCHRPEQPEWEIDDNEPPNQSLSA